MDDEYEFEEEDFETPFNGHTLRRILAQTRPHWRLLVGFLGAIVATALIDHTMTFLSKNIIDQAIIPHDLVRLRQLVLWYGGLIVVQAGFVFAFIYCTALLSTKVQYDLRRELFNHLQTLSFRYFDSMPIGWIISRVTSDSRRIGELVSWGILDTTWGVFSITSAVIFMMFINVKLALLVALVIPVLVIVASYFKKLILLEYRLVRKTNSKITGSYNEGITGVRVTKALGREVKNLTEFGELTSQMYGAAFRAAWLSAMFLPAVQIISAIAIAIIAWYGGWQAQQGFMTIGGIYAFVSYITFMMWPVQEMARVYAEMQQAIASGERIFSLIDMVPDIEDSADAIDPGTIHGEIAFQNVHFAYKEDKAVLTNFNLTVKPGETIALVGPTGGGKSTIVNLICRFYEPAQGKILFNGRDYTHLTQHAIQSRVGMVLQTPHLFSGTIRENLRYGRLDATDGEIELAAQQAGAHDFITPLDKGYDAEVGEGGILLSVGQKQLISLARAILANPEIFIMDEATSSVDTLTESLIQRGMEAIMKDRTSFIIAHRLSTIKRADRILVIEGGGISELGTHAELIRARGHYYRLYTQQFREQKERERLPYVELVGTTPATPTHSVTNGALEDDSVVNHA